mgnify:CR=1 FL=1
MTHIFLPPRDGVFAGGRNNVPMYFVSLKVKDRGMGMNSIVLK